jgi:lipopolysaccharide/colanic/teichoic acid biosynthesis glycosyltransferase
MKPVTRIRIFVAVYDLLLVAACTLFMAYLQDGPDMKLHNRSYVWAFSVFPPVWMILSLLTRKFRIGEHSNQKTVFLSILFSNFIILAFTTILMVMFQLTFFSRFIFFGTVIAITLLEMVTGFIYVAILQSVFLRDWIGLDIPILQAPPFRETGSPQGKHSAPGNYDVMRRSITEEAGEEAFEWLTSQMDITDTKNLIISTDTRFNVVSYPAGSYHTLVNLQRINRVRRINKMFETVNGKLPGNGIFIACVETYTLRKQRILAKFPFGINYLMYTLDFIFHRVFPKVVLTNKLYFLITRGNKRVLSRTEFIGRLYSCGFELLEEKIIGNLLYLKVRKTREPYYDTSPSYGFFIHLRRIGRDGKEFKVYKLRTMHAYAEYIQHYVYETSRLGEGGKFRDDFRVTTVGRFLRRFWLDELPMLVNVIAGNMKIVGVRPLSRHYFSLYSEELRNRRIKTKPGLIPPYYAQFPPPANLQEVQQNEMEYLVHWEKHPFTTDVRYFFRAMYNIVWRRARSR